MANERKQQGRGRIGRVARRSVAALAVVAAVAAYGLWANVQQARALEEVEARATSSQRGEFLKDGTFEGAARSFGGMMTVSAVVENGYITGVSIVETSDDNPYIERAEEQIPFRIVFNQAFTPEEVDVVTGATVSSRGIMNATNNALVDAGAVEGEKSGPAANSRTGAKSTSELKEMAEARHAEEAKEFYELSWHDQFGEDEYSGRHDADADVSGGFAGAV